MSNDTNIFETTFNGYFFLSLATIIVGFAHLTFRYCERSCCTTCEFCNCLKVVRTPEDNNIALLNRSKSLSTI